MNDAIGSPGGAPGPAGWLGVALSGPVVRRATFYMIAIGGVLIAINHGDALLRGDLDRVRLLKLVLTPLVPYCVSTLSSVSAIRALRSEPERERLS